MGVDNEDNLRPWVSDQELLSSAGVVSRWEVDIVDVSWSILNSAIQWPLDKHDL